MTKQPTISLDEKEYFDNLWNNAWDDWDEYAFWSNDCEYIIPEITHNIYPKSNQWLNKETKSACTMIGSLNQIIRLFWIDLSMEDSNKLWIELVNWCVKNGWYQIGYWRSTPTAINYVCKWWNELWRKKFNKEEVFYLRVDWKDKLVKEALDKWHLVGFTYSLDFWDDRYKGLVYKDSYPWATGHRTNWKSVSRTVATWWAKWDGCDVWVHDSYFLWTNEYFVKDRSKYMWKGMNTPAYIILPKSCMVDKTVEEVKTNIAEQKAINCLIWVMTSTWWDIPEKYQTMSANYAKDLRQDYEWARPLYDKQEEKVYQSVVDMLSYSYKYASPKYQEKYAQLASELRKEFNLK